MMFYKYSQWQMSKYFRCIWNTSDKSVFENYYVKVEDMQATAI